MVEDRRQEFRRLHEEGCFVIPNPWDVGSARYLESLGFKALATTSAGFAFSKGLADTAESISLDLVLQHLREMVPATQLPVNADFQNGFGSTSEEVYESAKLCIETGVAGFSIEDLNNGKLFELAESVDRLKAAKQAVTDSGADVLLTARAECYFVGHPEALPESIRRIRAYAEAGADVLFVPGLNNRDDIESVVNAVKPKPVNLIMSSFNGLSLADVAGLGVRRVSTGSALARAAWTGFMEASKKIAEEGSFAGLLGLVPYQELSQIFKAS